MKPSDSRVCGACGARNKPKWEFCVRCGESLKDVAEASVPLKRAPVAVDAGDRSSFAWMGGVAMLGVLVIVAYAAWIWTRPAETPKEADASIFRLVTTVPARTPVTAVPRTAGPGDADYQAGVKLLQGGDYAGAVARLAHAIGAEPDNALYHNT